MTDFTIAGVDGCKAGWIAALQDPVTARTGIAVFATMAELMARHPALVAIAVDMPIGLPDRIEGSGRAAERAVRPLLGARQSSVFSIPVRAAVEAEDYRAACAQALAGSNPPRKVAKQGFFLFPKIREIDALLRRHAGLAEALVETHPELVFRRLKGVPLTFAKKTPEGLVERRALLRDAGIAEEALMQAPPRGAGTDDLLDALACLLTAARLARGKACPHPDPFERDRYGNPIAIWA